MSSEEMMNSHSESTLPTRIEIEGGLRRLGLTRGDTVEVHSSLSSLGWVEGGAAAVVDALMNVVGEEGALVMSAYPLSKPLLLTEEEKARGILAKVQIYGEDYNGPTGMGVIADEFRQRPGTMLGPGFIGYVLGGITPTSTARAINTCQGPRHR